MDKGAKCCNTWVSVSAFEKRRNKVFLSFCRACFGRNLKKIFITKAEHFFWRTCTIIIELLSTLQFNFINVGHSNVRFGLRILISRDVWRCYATWLFVFSYIHFFEVFLVLNVGLFYFSVYDLWLMSLLSK